MSKHTSGPYSVNGVFITAGSTYVAVVESRDTSPRERRKNAPSLDEAYANARLLGASFDMLKALANLARFCKGRLGRNPYGVDEYKAALVALGKAIGYKGDWMDTLEAVAKAGGKE